MLKIFKINYFQRLIRPPINGGRLFCNKPPEQVTEKLIMDILKIKFPNSKTINVEDVSGGCGAMFNIFIETSDFKGMSIVKQHRVVYDSLETQIKSIHGLHLETKAA